MTDKPYTPTTEQVREAFSVPWHEPEVHDIGEYGAAFDRWLAERDAGSKAEGFDEALALLLNPSVISRHDTAELEQLNPYRMEEP